MSRGGLIIYNWASENTGKVVGIYADAPVCDLRSWPGGKFDGKGSPADWKRALKAHGQKESTIDDYKFVPIYTSIKVAEAKIPALHICGAADEVVPYEENAAVVEKNYKNAGGEVQIVLKDGVGHHPHSLKDPKTVVDFIVSSYAKAKQ
jgi:alpha-beta hydrolase superfamily lysophospholipase